MYKRTTEVLPLLETMEPYLPIEGFDPEEWLNDENNIALTNGEGDFALFEYEYLGVYSGHYFYKARGKKALQASKEFLKHLFTNYYVRAIRGLSPLEHLGARWLNKQLGFKSYGILETPVGPHELVILTKQEWEAFTNE